MRLTLEEHPQAIKRYAHLKPAPALGGVRPCSTPCPGTTRACTREKGHRGPHASHGPLRRRVVAVWDSAGVPALATGKAMRGDAAPRATRAPRKGQPIGLRDSSPRGLLPALSGMLKKAVSEADQIAFVILFIVFVKFAIDVVLAIMLKK